MNDISKAVDKLLQVTNQNMQDTTNVTATIQENILLTSDVVQDVHHYLDKKIFQHQQEEIQFFKTIKPKVDGLLIYYQHLQRIEQQCLIGTKERKIQYYERAISDLRVFYLLNAEFHRYLLLQGTHLDEYYYARDPASKYLLDDDCTVTLSATYNTKMSYKAACFYAFSQLQDWLISRIRTLEKCTLAKDPYQQGTSGRNKLIWTASKTALAELIYALQEYGVFNNTKLKIGTIAEYFAYVFEVDLLNIYKMYEDIRIRKKSRTPFLDGLRSSLIRRLETDDENAL